MLRLVVVILQSPLLSCFHVGIKRTLPGDVFCSYEKVDKIRVCSFSLLFFSMRACVLFFSFCSPTDTRCVFVVARIYSARPFGRSYSDSPRHGTFRKLASFSFYVLSHLLARFPRFGFSLLFTLLIETNRSYTASCSAPPIRGGSTTADTTTLKCDTTTSCGIVSQRLCVCARKSPTRTRLLLWRLRRPRPRTTAMGSRVRVTVRRRERRAAF